MPQKRMAARGQSAKLAKGPSLKKAPLAKAPSAKASGDKTKDLAKKAKTSATGRPGATKFKPNGKTAAKSPAVNGKDAGPQAQIEMAKAALKTATPTHKTDKKVTLTKSPMKTPVKSTATIGNTAQEKPLKETKAAKAESKRGRKISIDIDPNEAASALSGKWGTLFKKAEQIEAKPYNMKAVFEEKTAITHKVLGWGYILANRNDRLEVLFKDGIKYLISNYKP